MFITLALVALALAGDAPSKADPAPRELVVVHGADAPARAAAWGAALKKSDGTPIVAARFVDDDGVHVVVITRTEPVVRPAKGDEDASRTQRLFAFDLDANQKERWRAQDFVESCSFDLFLDVEPHTFSVTDLDRNGKAEVAFSYVLGCASDVSPQPRKLLMYEAGKKHALRGSTKVVLGSDEQTGLPLIDGDDYTIDPAFAAAPTAFQKHAEMLWSRAR